MYTQGTVEKATLNLVPDWIRYLGGRLPDETSHASDDFFGSDTDSDYTKTTVSGTASWEVARGRYLVTAEDQTSEDWAVALKAIPGTPTPPMTIETAFSLQTTPQNSPAVGLVFTDGTTATNNVVSGTQYTQNTTRQVRLAQGTLTAHGSLLGTNVILSGWFACDPLYIQLIWTAANTWKMRYGASETQWHDFTGAQSDTMTPTHFGFAISGWAGADKILNGFHYFRVYDSDESA